MEQRTLEWFELLARALIWAAGVVLVLSIIGAISIAGSDSSLPFFEDLQRQGRAVGAVGAVGGGVAAAGVLSGLGAILRLMLDDRAERERAHGPGAASPEGEPRG